MKNSVILILGTFNPPTKAHIDMSYKLHELYPKADICYVPANLSYVHQWKGDKTQVLGLCIRKWLIEQSVDNTYCYVSEFEYSDESDGKTYTTAEYFRTLYHNVYLCIGDDNLKQITNWDNSDKLLSRYKFLVFTRNLGISQEILEAKKYLGKYLDNIEFIEYKYSEISSTQVREAYNNNNLDMVSKYLTPCILKYLKLRRRLNHEIFRVTPELSSVD